MPLYEFRCEDCGAFDVWRPMAESSDPAHCPECNERGKRIFSPPMTLSRTVRIKKVSSEPELVKRGRVDNPLDHCYLSSNSLVSTPPPGSAAP